MVAAAPWMLAFALCGFVVLLAFGRRLGEPIAGWVATAAIAGAFVCAVVTWLGLLGRNDCTVTITLFDWLPLAGSQVKVALLVDPLSTTMCLFVTGVSALIHLYSIGYMHGERDYTKFFVYLNLFVFSMLLLVLADNLLITFIGWEGVGVCSYWLVSYYYDKDSAASAGPRHLQPGRGHRLPSGHVLLVHPPPHARVLGHRQGRADAVVDGHESSSCSCCSQRPGSPPQSRCSTGSPTPWRVRPRCPPSSTPRPW